MRHKHEQYLTCERFEGEPKVTWTTSAAFTSTIPEGWRNWEPNYIWKIGTIPNVQAKNIEKVIKDHFNHHSAEVAFARVETDECNIAIIELKILTHVDNIGEPFEASEESSEVATG